MCWFGWGVGSVVPMPSPDPGGVPGRIKLYRDRDGAAWTTFRRWSSERDPVEFMPVADHEAVLAETSEILGRIIEKGQAAVDENQAKLREMGYVS